MSRRNLVEPDGSGSEGPAETEALQCAGLLPALRCLREEEGKDHHSLTITTRNPRECTRYVGGASKDLALRHMEA